MRTVPPPTAGWGGNCTKIVQLSVCEYIEKKFVIVESQLCFWECVRRK